MTALVVLPGLDGTGLQLRAFLDAALAHFSPAVAIGYPVDQILGYHELETFARTLLPTQTDFVLVGESFSGPIALSIAADPPPNMVGLVLSATFASSPVAWMKPFARLVRFMPTHTLPMSLLSWWLLGEWSTAQLRSSLRTSLLGVSANVLRARAQEALTANSGGQLAHISMRVLVLQAGADRLLDLSAARRILRGIPQARVAAIPGPHLLLQTQPKMCADATARFMDEFPAGAPGTETFSSAGEDGGEAGAR